MEGVGGGTIYRETVLSKVTFSTFLERQNILWKKDKQRLNKIKALNAPHTCSKPERQ